MRFRHSETGAAYCIVPALRNVREGLGSHFCVCAGEVKSLGYPPVENFKRKLVEADDRSNKSDSR
jgi:hypothetical protein